MTMTRHHRDGVTLAAPPRWAVDPATTPDGTDPPVLALVAPAGPSGHRPQVRVALHPTTGDDDEADTAAALERFLTGLDRPLLIDLEVTTIAGAPGHRALAAAEAEGVALTIERWWRLWGEHVLTLTTAVDTAMFAHERAELLGIVESLELEDG